VSEGRFREDLFHRINVIRIHIPALRERRQDIPLLLNHFLKEASAELNVEPKTLRPEVRDFLARLDWPGNVRQLENTCRWITVMASGREVHMDDLPPELTQESKPAATPAAAPESCEWAEPLRRWTELRLGQGGQDIAKDAIDRAESILIETAVRHTRGHRQDAARLLGYGRNTLTRKIKELKLDV
jgi:two-component system nitrogen regulation response regulator GlnG